MKSPVSQQIVAECHRRMQALMGRRPKWNRFDYDECHEQASVWPEILCDHLAPPRAW